MSTVPFTPAQTRVHIRWMIRRDMPEVLAIEHASFEHAWTEDPPSRLRHFVTNVRVFETDVPGEVLADSAMLLFRSRGDVNEPSIISAHREDVFRDVGGEYKLARRVILVDESVLRTQNLAIFL